MILIKLEDLMMFLEEQEETDFEGARWLMSIASHEEIPSLFRLELCLVMMDQLGLRYQMAKPLPTSEGPDSAGLKGNEEKAEDHIGLEMTFPVEEFAVDTLNGTMRFAIVLN